MTNNLKKTNTSATINNSLTKSLNNNDIKSGDYVSNNLYVSSFKEMVTRISCATKLVTKVLTRSDEWEIFNIQSLPSIISGLVNGDCYDLAQLFLVGLKSIIFVQHGSDMFIVEHPDTNASVITRRYQSTVINLDQILFGELNPNNITVGMYKGDDKSISDLSNLSSKELLDNTYVRKLSEVLSYSDRFTTLADTTLETKVTDPIDNIPTKTGDDLLIEKIDKAVQVVSDAFNGKGDWEGIAINEIPFLLQGWFIVERVDICRLFILGLKSSIIIPLDDKIVVVKRKHINARIIKNNICESVLSQCEYLTAHVCKVFDCLTAYIYTAGAEYLDDMEEGGISINNSNVKEMKLVDIHK